MSSRHPVKFVHWSENYSYLAMMSKYNITITDNKLRTRAKIPETSKIKSGCWDENFVFIYSTSNHLKYALPSGDHGIIKTLTDPLYLARVHGNRVVAIDRELNIQNYVIDNTEYMFKLALLKGQVNDILKIIQTSRLVGESIIGYLQRKGYPEIALQFVDDKKNALCVSPGVRGSAGRTGVCE